MGVKSTELNKRLFIEAWKAERGCSNCDEHDPVVLDCHHRDEETKNPRLRPRIQGYPIKLSQLSWDDLETELAKCVVLCANCHRRETRRRSV